MLGALAPTFRSNFVDGKALVHLTKRDLKTELVSPQGIISPTTLEPPFSTLVAFSPVARIWIYVQMFLKKPLHGFPRLF